MADLLFVALALGASRCSPWRSKAASGSEENANMIVDYVIGGVVAVLLLGYLAYALLRPEKF